MVEEYSGTWNGKFSIHKRMASSDIYITQDDFDRTQKLIPGYYTVLEDGTVINKHNRIVTITNNND